MSRGGGECEHAPIERQARGAHGLGHQPFEKSHRRKGDRESGQRAERGEHQGFDRETGTPACRAPRRVPRAPRLPCRRVAPRESSRFVRLTQAIKRSAPDALSSRISAVRVLPAISARRRRDDHRTGAAKVLRRDLQTQRRHRLLCVLHGDAGLESRHDLRVMPRQVRPHEGRERRRHPHVDLARGHEVEVPRHDADHFVGLVVERDLTSDDVGRAAESALPQSVADDDDAHALVVFVLGEGTPEQGCTPRTLQNVHVTFRAGDQFGFAVAGERRIGRLRGCEIREDGIEAAPLNPFRGCGVVPRVISVSPVSQSQTITRRSASA